METELMKDSTRIKLLNDVVKDISVFNEQLWNKIVPGKDEKINVEYEMALLFSVVYLDFLVCLKNLLSSSLFWENTVAFKQIHKIIFESHNKIYGKVIVKKDGSLDYEQTRIQKNNSIWFGKMLTFITNKNESEYNKISDSLEKFRKKTDLNYINRIRNFDGHYSNLDDYMNEIKIIDMDKTINIAVNWFFILREARNFSLSVNIDKEW
jgi:hypothetical protein